MTVARTLAYERMKRVARTETELLPLSLAATVEYLLRKMMAATSSQMYMGKADWRRTEEEAGFYAQVKI